MKELVRQYLDRDISRRKLMANLSAVGLGAVAAKSMVEALAPVSVAAATANPGAIREVKGSGGQGEAELRCFELDADTEIETRDYGTMTVAELERFMRARRDGAATLRCSGTFHDPTRVRTDSHLINWGRRGLGIWDSMTETTWHRRERAPSATFTFLEQLKKRSPFK